MHRSASLLEIPYDMEKYRNKYRIPSARASWWDYSANGCYFITICTANRECLFGHIVETHGCASQNDHASQNSDAFVSEEKRSYKSISSFVAGFKSSATKQINIYRDMPGVPVWQTRFYDRIIRNAYEYRHIVNYIHENPLKWKEDELYESEL